MKCNSFKGMGLVAACAGMVLIGCTPMALGQGGPTETSAPKPIPATESIKAVRPIVRRPSPLPKGPSGVPASHAVAPRESAPQLQQDGYAFATNAVGEAVILGFDKSYSGSLAITNALGGCRVTGIGNSAFEACSSLTSVTIPESVTKIGDWAFGNCTNLVDIVLPSRFARLEEYFRIGISGRQVAAMLDKDGKADTLGQQKKYGCTFVRLNGAWRTKTETDIDGLPVVDPWRDIDIYWLKQLDELVNRHGIVILRRQTAEHIGIEDHFEFTCLCNEWNGTLENFSGFMKGLRQLGFMIDVAQVSLRPVPQQQGVYRGAFTVRCAYRVEQTPDQRTPRLQQDGYTFCTNAVGEAVILGFDKSYSGSLAITNALGGCRVTGIGAFAFRGSTNLTSVTIPIGVSRIGDSAFRYCRSLTAVTIPGSVTNVDRYAFSECTNLLSLTIAEGVAKLAYDAFSECRSLSMVTLPSSVTEVFADTFSGCASMTSIQVDARNPAYVSVDGVLFNKKLTELVMYPAARVGSYIIPDGVQQLGGSAFMDCTNMDSVAIPGSVRRIDGSTFAFCHRMTSITVADDSPCYQSDKDGVLYDKRTCTLVRYPAGRGGDYSILPHTKTIGSAAFSGSMALARVTIPASVTNVEDRAFSGCFNLIAVKLSPGVTSIGAWAFNGCTNLTSITIPTGVANIEYMVFSGCSSLTSVTIPDSVTRIEGNAFYRCSNLTSVTIPAGVTDIGNAFPHCKSLASVYFKGDAPRGGSDSSIFWGAKNATVYYRPGTKGWGATFGGQPTAVWNKNAPVARPDATAVVPMAVPSEPNPPPSTKPIKAVRPINRPSSASELTAQTKRALLLQQQSLLQQDGYAFCTNAVGEAVILGFDKSYSGALAITNTLGGCRVTNIGGDAFKFCSSLTSVTIPFGVTKIEDSAFESCSHLTTVTIPDSATSIGAYAFRGCQSLTSVALPLGVTRIGLATFGGCSRLSSVTIPASVTDIGGSAFYRCFSLSSVTIPDSVTSIGAAAFKDCRTLTSVTIPASVTVIGGSAFSNCDGLKSIHVEADNASYCSVDGVLFDKGKTQIMNFPADRGGRYTIPDGVTRIGAYAFKDCLGLTSVTIPNGVTSIEYGIFSGCSGLTSVTIPSSVTNIKASAFSDCHGLADIHVEADSAAYGSVDGVLFDKAKTRIIRFPAGRAGSYTIPDGATSIEDSAFSSCFRLTSVTIPDSVTHIEASAFSDCSSLTAVTIPNGVTSIGFGAFFGCSNLTSVTIPTSVTRIEALAFSRCASLTAVTIPGSVTNIGYRVFTGCSRLTSVVIPDSVSRIGNSAFSDCPCLAAINAGVDNAVYGSRDGVLFNKARTELIRCPGGKTGSYAIPAGVTNIASMAFSGCSSLTAVTIPDSVTAIGGSAFGNCDGLKAITIPASVNDIESGAFDACGHLSEVCFEGDAPIINSLIFNASDNVTVYYRPGTKGWGREFGGRPTKVWKP